MDLNTQPGNLPVIASTNNRLSNKITNHRRFNVYVSSPLHSVVWSEQTKICITMFLFYYESNMLSEMLVTLTAHLILVKNLYQLIGLKLMKNYLVYFYFVKSV